MDNIDLTNIKRTLNNKHLLESLDLTAFVTDVVNAFAQMRANHKEMTQEHKDVLSLALKQLNAEHDRIVKDVETSQQKSKSDVTDALNKAISMCENMCHEVMAMKPMDGKDGIDGVDGKDGIDGKDGSPDTGEQIVDKINKQEKKIKAKNIEGLDKQIVKNTQHIISSGVNKVVAGTGITISSSQGNGKGDITITASGGAGLGDVVGPVSSVDSNIATFDGVTGKLIKDSGAKVSDFITSAVTSIKKTGSTSLTGNVTLSEGSNITLTQTGNDISIASTSGGGDMVLASVQSVTGLKTFDKDKLAMKGTSTGKTVVSTANTSATDYTATLPAKDGTIAMTSDITGTNSGTNTGDQTITNSSDATSHTVTLSGSGGSVQLVEGSGITLTTTGTGSAGIVTIASTSGGGGTVTATGGSLTSNAVVLGAGTTDTKVSTGITTDGTSQLNLGINATTIGKVKMFGSTSGDVTIQPTAAAGTATVQTLPATTGTLVNRVTTANGVSASNSDGALTVTLGAITPTSVNSVIVSGSSTPTLSVTGTTSVSGSNTGDNAANSSSTYIGTTAVALNRTSGALSLTGVNIDGSAGTATTATNANNVNLANDVASATDYLVFTNTATGNQPLKTNTGVSVNPSTAAITATTFIGALTGTASGNLVSGGALGTPSSGTLTNCTFPTLNQDTTGSAIYWKTSGTGKASITGPATGTTRTYTFPDADSTILYSGGALGTPASGTLTNCTGLPVAGITASTSTALGVGSIELGHASDTSITRVSAGVAAIEGNNIVTNTSSPTLATITTTGNIELGHATDTTISRVSAGVAAIEGSKIMTVGSTDTVTGVKTMSSIVLPTNGQVKLTVPTTDGHATGPTCGDFNCGYSSSAVGDLVYLDSSSTWQKCDANTVALYNGLLGIALEVKASANALLVALPGSFVYATGFPALTVGSPCYMSETAGAITQTAPTTTDAATRVIGWAIHADKIYFNPSQDYSTHV